MAEFRVLVGLGNAPYGSSGLVAGARMQARPPFAGPVDPANHATPHATLSPDTNARIPSEVAQAWLKKGFGRDRLVEMQRIVDAEKSDLFDVLEYISFAIKPITRETRVAGAQSKIFAMLNNKQKEFLEFVLSKYIETGVEELDQEKLPDLLMLKYQTISDAAEMLGGVDSIKTTFIDFQKHLYSKSTTIYE